MKDIPYYDKYLSMIIVRTIRTNIRIVFKETSNNLKEN